MLLYWIVNSVRKHLEELDPHEISYASGVHSTSCTATTQTLPRGCQSGRWDEHLRTETNWFTSQTIQMVKYKKS